MATTTLPENFFLPTGEDYDDIIKSLDDDIKEEDGARYFMGLIRHGRKHSHPFQTEVLGKLSTVALLLEKKDARGITIDRNHRTANAILSGAILGTLVNESAYPNFNIGYFPYRSVRVIGTMIEGDDKLAFEEAVKSKSEFEARRIGFGAMAGYSLSSLSEASSQTLDAWSRELIPSPAFRESFRSGFGIALFAAWDLYGDKIQEEGRLIYEEREPATVSEEE